MIAAGAVYWRSTAALAGDTTLGLDSTAPLSLSTAAPITTGSTPVGASTPSQQDNPQLNQLFQFEVTPDICAAGEGYLSGQFGRTEEFNLYAEYRYQLQGQYGITDQIAAGARLPYVYDSALQNSITRHGLGDVELYGQYKFDKLIDPKAFSLTAQLSVVLPTGSETELRDEGKFGIRPFALAYKDFGAVGPGRLGAYGQLGFTLSGDSDVRWGLAATYEYARVVGVLELSGEDGSNYYGNIALFTPGLVYRGLDHFELAVGVPLGLTNDSPDWGVQAKVTYVFAN